ncbi:hypothetical protein P7K49_012597 [Saguinus oedipus]|uniref:Uncharacterized protein n=1 Tax=Saguinus oedipus TaxID=9490 RepID=A0ABQ9VDI2_SAGOE|nr:hypothetical protein P7K49_012597 [Saguinus oedipus]
MAEDADARAKRAGNIKEAGVYNSDIWVAGFGSSCFEDIGNTEEQSFKVLTTCREQTQQSSRIHLALNGQVSQALKRHLELDMQAQVSKAEPKAAKASILLQARKFRKAGQGLIS